MLSKVVFIYVKQWTVLIMVNGKNALTAVFSVKLSEI